MDGSRKPGTSAPTGFPWQSDEESRENLGATGIFGTIPKSTIDRNSGSLAQTSQEGNSAESGEVPEIPPEAPVPGGREVLQEPIVHKVLLGGGSATTASIDLLELLRTHSPKPELATGLPLAEPEGLSAIPIAQPISSSPAQSSEGFTQLLRALGGDSSPAPPAIQPEVIERTVASSGSRFGSTDSGFTALLRSSNTSDLKEQPEKRPDFEAPSPSAPPVDGAGGFTALLQGFSGRSPTSVAQPASRMLDESPSPDSFADRPTAHTVAAPPYASGHPVPGAFTQLFSTLTSENPAALKPAQSSPSGVDTPGSYPDHSAASRPSGEGTSFTQLISTIGEGSSKATQHDDNRPSVPDDFSQRSSPGRAASLGSSEFSTDVTDWSRVMPPQPESSSGSGGLTQLLRILDEPSKAPATLVAHPPAGAPAPSPAVGSLFTQTYRKLNEPTEPPPPEVPAAYQPPSRMSATQPFASPFTGGIFPGQSASAPAAPNLPTGPSDVTRIIDASKLREMQRQGVFAPGPINPVTPGQCLSAPVPPAPPNLQWQPPVPPTPAAWQPPQYTPPAIPAPQVSAPAPVTAPTPALGKMQQYLPLLLIIIIFLLIVILVTVVFLLKH
jgi:hypothetical protein